MAKIRAAILAGLMLIATAVALAVPATASAQEGYRVCVARNIDNGAVYVMKVRKGDAQSCSSFKSQMAVNGQVPVGRGQYKDLDTCERFTQAWLNNRYGGDACRNYPMQTFRIYYVTGDRYLVPNG